MNRYIYPTFTRPAFKDNSILIRVGSHWRDATLTRQITVLPNRGEGGQITFTWDVSPEEYLINSITIWPYDIFIEAFNQIYE